ncbi:hypothetical protein [Mesorhizobium sp. M0643]|uniref:hypothetical protein n=1 Tax=Mesorhizobium sp. M0643 TaxID=2956978 RepID=UPI003339C2E4
MPRMMARHWNHHFCRQYTPPRVAADLKAVWAAPTTDARLKKRIVRAVIREVVADIDEEASEIVLLIHWMAASTPNFACRGGGADSATALRPTSAGRRPATGSHRQ